MGSSGVKRGNEESGNLLLDDDKKDGQTADILGIAAAVSGGSVCRSGI